MREQDRINITRCEYCNKLVKQHELRPMCFEPGVPIEGGWGCPSCFANRKL